MAPGRAGAHGSSRAGRPVMLLAALWLAAATTTSPWRVPNRVVVFADSVPVLETGAQAPMPDQWIDRETGHRVIRLTKRAGANTSFYFNNPPFFPAEGGRGEQMAFYGATLAGRQLFTVDLRTHAISQITDHPGGVSGEIVAPRHREVVYKVRDSIFATNIDTRGTRLLYVLPPDMLGGISTLNADETVLAGVVAGPEEREILAKYPKKGDYFTRIFDAHIPHTIFTIDLKTGTLRKVHEENTWLGHLQFSPTDPNLLMFCHEGPWHLVDRIWTIDLETGAVRKTHERSMAGEIAGHEFWSADGKTIWYDLQIPRSVTFYLAGVDVATGRSTRYALSRDEWSIHYNVSRDGSLFAGDGGDSSQVARAPHGRWLYLFRPSGDHVVSEKLVDMSRHDYHLEPNVHFSPDGRWVIFRARFGDGEADVYAVEAGSAGR